MAVNETPWDQTPGYLAMTATTVLPGGVTSYAVPRPQGPAPGDVTSFHPGQANWSKDNLTWVMYELSPSAAWKDFARSALPKVKRDNFGEPMLEAWPEPGKDPRELLDFGILPDIIGTRESPLLIEEWRRWDGRVRWHDIIMRMPHPRPSANILNMRATRMRLEYHMLSWHVKAVHDKENASRDVVLKLLTKEQISANTTRGTTPGLVDPSLGIFSPSIPHPPEKSASALAKVGWFKTSTSSGKRSSNKFSKEFTKTVKKISAPKVKKVKKSMMMDSTRDNETIDTIEGQPMNSSVFGQGPNTAYTQPYQIDNIDFTKISGFSQGQNMAYPRPYKLHNTDFSKTSAFNQGPIMTYSQEHQDYDTTFYELEVPSHFPCSTTNQLMLQNTASFDLKGQASGYDYSLFEEGLGIQPLVGDQGHTSQGILAEGTPAMVLPSSPRHMPTEATEEASPHQHEFDDEFLNTFFSFSAHQDSQVSEDAEALDGSWLIPDYQRAGFSDFTCQ